MNTPIVKLSDKDLETVYEPAEDSFLLIDVLEADLEILKAVKPTMCLEIGSGSGIVIAALAMALKEHCQPFHMAVDINTDACKITKRTAVRNLVEVDSVRMDLLSCIRSDRVFDIVVFNPPYVVTSDEEISNKQILFKAWAGGTNGRKVMERVFSKIPDILSDVGTFYLLVIKENDPEHILRIFTNMNMVGKIVAERKVRGEHLHVLRFKKVR
ncbi:HemK methyltransferase family member 2 [Habropoda laboriosa]|uniref:Methyltransferase HEMK2 n=1 Tax=Habropoda laboriosa TaxID=597456 RepID=A0A0L7QS81_9HYME|nr:PREDICTED: hemK methyltransferase family member 2 [Habropoda laboriosa]KOC61497.1 HemK methyltransferase family member 2 [Habropoda laboriosa]